MQISRKRYEIEARYQIPTNRKWPLADQMMTSWMTSRDPDGSKSWHSYIYMWSRLGYYLASTGN